MSNKLWYEKYTELSSALFTFDNSGNKINEVPPYCEKKGDDFEVLDIHAPYGSSWELVGYTKNPPFQPETYHAVAIMFENKSTFERIWWHFRSGEDIDVKTLPIEYFGRVEELRFDSDAKWRQEQLDTDEEDDDD